MRRRAILIFFLLILPPILPAFGAEQERDPAAVLQEAGEAEEKGDLETAAEKYRAALTILEKQNDPKTTANTFYKLGAALVEVGRYSEALSALKKALEMHRGLGDKAGTGFDLTSLARLNFMEGNQQEALALTDDALAVHEEIQNQKGIAETLLIGGSCYFRMDEFQKASDYLNRSLSISKEIENKPGIQQSLNMLGVVMWEQGDLERSLQFFQDAIPIAEQLSDPGGLSALFSNMGLIYADKGEFDKALEYLNKGLEIDRKRGDRSGIATSLYNISTVLGDQSNYEKSREAAQEALSIAEEIGDKSLVSSCLDVLGNLDLLLGNYDTALQYLERSARISEEIEDKSGLAYTLKKIGTLYLNQDKYAQAVPFYLKALRIFEEIGVRRGTALTLNNLGNVHSRLGETSQALQDFQKALSIAQAMGIRPAESESYVGIGAAYYSKSEMEEAEESLSKSIAISKQIWHPTSLWRALHKMSLVYRDTGRTEQALESMKESVEVIERVRGELQLAQEKSGYFQEKLDVYQDLVQLLVSAQQAPEAFEFAQRAKARSFLDMLAEARIDPVGNINPQLKEKKKALLAQLVAAQKSLESAYEKSPSDQKRIGLLSEKRSGLDHEYTNLMLEIRKENPRYADVQYSKPVTLREAQQMLDGQTILLEYFMAKTRSFLFAVTKDDFRTYELPGDEKLSVQIRQMSDLFQKPHDVSENGVAEYRKLSSTLYSELVRPAESDLQGKRRILIAPDGPLNYLPFEGLVTNDSTKSLKFSELPYVSLTFEIHYMPSISVLAAVREHHREHEGQKQLIAFANPMIRGEAESKRAGLVRDWVGTLGALPFTAKEVEEIAKLYGTEDVSILVGESASEHNVKKMKMDSYRKVHFASHGLIDEEKPEFSSLVLSPGEEEDGFLTMREAFDLNLNAELVVLSACKSGLGQNIRGEGISGLSRAFIVAGTSAVLVSLWDVYDKTTADFMKSFYTNIERNHMSKTEALKQVRKEMIQSGKSSHPYYWAAFVLIGDE